MASRFVPDRGDAVWIDFDPQVGHEQSGRRPALVLTPSFYNRASGLILACPVTSRAKGYPFEVPPPPGSTLRGAILADQVKSMAWAERRAELLCRVPQDFVDHVILQIRSLLRS